MNNTSKIQIFLISLLFLFSLSCSTYIKVKLLKPAEINIGSIKDVAILNFEFSGSRTLENSSRVRNDTKSYPGNWISDKLTESLLANGHYNVIEREKISNILAEQGFSSSGFTTQSDSLKLGKLLGIEALFAGSGNYNVEDKTIWEYREKDEKGVKVTYRVFKIVRNAQIKISYRVIDTTTGKLIGSRTISADNTYSSPYHSEVEVNGVVDEYATNSEKTKALQELISWNRIVDSLIDTLIPRIVNQVAPHYITVDREIKGGDSPFMKDALENSKKDLWNNAKDLWESVLSDTSEIAKKDHGAAMHNLGIFHEINGNLDMAEEYFNQCYSISKFNECKNGLERIMERKNELLALKEQGRANDTELNKKEIDINTLINNGNKFFRMKEYEKAINEFFAALKNEPLNPSIHYSIGLIYKEQKRSEKAIISFQESIKYSPEYAEAYYQIAMILREQGRIEESSAYFKQAFKLKPSLAGNEKTLSENNSSFKPDNSESINKGIEYFNKGMFGEAVEEYLKALKINNQDADTFNNLGVSYYSLGKTNDAIQAYKQALLLKRDFSQAYYNLGLAYQKLGQNEDAIREYKNSCIYGNVSICNWLKENRL